MQATYINHSYKIGEDKCLLMENRTFETNIEFVSPQIVIDSAVMQVAWHFQYQGEN